MMRVHLIQVFPCHVLYLVIMFTTATTQQKPLLLNIQSSDHMRNLTSLWPGAWSTEKAVFLAVADSEYFYFVQNLVNSLVSMQYSVTDIVIGCTTSDCLKNCEHFNYRCHYNEIPISSMPQCKSQWSHTRCFVSAEKIQSTINMLSNGYVVIVVDLDVFFKKDPLSAFFPLVEFPIVSMFDSPINQPSWANFGMFIVRPCNVTVDMFIWMKREFLRTGEWDQSLYNKFISQQMLPVQRLDNESFVNYAPYGLLERGVRISNQSHQAVAIHTTCVEGSYTKFYIARTMYGRVHNSKLYNGHPTVSAVLQLNSSLHEKASFINILINISRQTDRWIRIIGSTSDHAASTFSADKLAKQNIFLVEETYWKSVTEFNSSSSPKSAEIEIISIANLSLQHFNQSYADIDDLVIKISPSLLSSVPELQWKSERFFGSSWLCKFLRESRGKKSCLVQCDGNHF